MEQCAICHEDLKTSKATIECGHTFHYSCIFQWHQNHSTCPLCRDIDETVAEINNQKEQTETNLIEDIVDNENLSVMCRGCNIEAYRCPDCYNLMCYCDSTNEYFYGKNPFSNENYVESCLKCFQTRDEHLVELIGDLVKTLDFNEIFETFELEEIYDKYYFNKKYNGGSIEGYQSFKDYEDFKSHARHIYEMSINH